jgi:hypothetical protein
MEEPEFEAPPMSPFAAIGWTLGVTVLWMLLAGLVASVRGSSEPDLITTGGCVAASYVLGLFGILRLHAPEASIRRFLALRKTHVLFFLAAPLLAVTVRAFSDVLYDLIVTRYPLPPEVNTDAIILAASPARRAAFFAVLVVAGPAAEEVLFRGAIVQGLRKTEPMIVAGAISAGVFALAHVTWQEFAPIFVCGGVLAALRLASGSLWPGLLMHATFNAIGFVLVFRSTSSEEITKHQVPLVLLGLAGTGVILWLLRALSNTEAAQRARQLDHRATDRPVDGAL